MHPSIKPIFDGYHKATPYLTVNDAAAALDFYQKSFGIRDVLRPNLPDGKVGHTAINENRHHDFASKLQP